MPNTNGDAVRSRERLIFALVALAGALLIMRGLVQEPSFTDAYYHFNAAQRLVTGHGLTDAYLWVYIGAPESLPAPSHLYWMPLTSLIATSGMWLLNAPGDYAAAQFPFVLMLAGAAYVSFWLGERLGQTRRHAWLAGLMTLLGGFFMRFWGSTDVFAPYALIGSLCLVLVGLAVENRHGRRTYLLYALVGGLAGLGHLTRADGVLLLFVCWAAVLWPFYRSAQQREAELPLTQRLLAVLVITAAYTVVMLPWFLRNLEVVGTPLPVGGAQAIWLTEYNDMFSYPADAAPETLFENGPGLFLQSRWEAITNNLGTLVAVEGAVVLALPMLVGLWRRRASPFLRGFWIYALGLHLAMTLIFPYPGLRGGLFHSAAALVPWWMALGVAGLDDMVGWVARRRRHWKPRVAKRIFSVAALFFVAVLSIAVTLTRGTGSEMILMYDELAAVLPPDARVMSSDPAELYYHTGLGGVVLPNEAPPVIQQIARRYDIDYLVLELEVIDGQTVPVASAKLRSILTAPPDFLTEIDIDVPGTRLYAIES